MLVTWIILFLLLSAFFSGCEIAFVSANRLKIKVKEDGASRTSNIITGFYEKPREFLGSMLVGNNIALVAFTSLFGALLSPQIERYITNPFAVLLILTIIATIIVLIFGEYLPKTIFQSYSTKLLYALAFPLWFLKLILIVPARIMTKLSNWIIKYVMNSEVESMEEVFTRVDLENYLDESIDEDVEDIDAEMLKKAIHFNSVKVRDCMVPRTEIVHIDQTTSMEDLIQEFSDSKKSRLLITVEDIDHVIGYIHHQSILDRPDKIRRRHIMTLPFVPESMPVNNLLLEFIKLRKSIALVVDEFGSTAGIITMEDILEEIFGEIVDEHDSEDYFEKQLSENEFLFSGRQELNYLMEKYESLEFSEGEYHTISGYLVMTSGNIPEEGELLEMDGMKFIIEAVSDTKIELVRIIIPDRPQNTEEEGT